MPCSVTDPIPHQANLRISIASCVRSPYRWGRTRGAAVTRYRYGYGYGENGTMPDKGVFPWSGRNYWWRKMVNRDGEWVFLT